LEPLEPQGPEPNVAAKAALQEVVIDHLSFLAAKITWAIVLQVVPLQSLRSPTPIKLFAAHSCMEFHFDQQKGHDRQMMLSTYDSQRKRSGVPS
jgi:hypothetical protein